MLKGIILLVVAVGVGAAIAGPALKSTGWNELVYADGIFGDHLNTIQYKSSGDTDLLQEFKNLLNEERNLQDVYKNYRTTFGKPCNNFTDETKARLETFKENLIEIAAHNLDARAGKQSWFMGVNQFTDMLSSDPEMIRTNFANDTADELNSRPYKSTSQTGAPASVNYVSQNVVTPVKNQGKCQSCSMFSSAAILESAVARKYKSAPVSLSVQELVDCAVRGFNCLSGSSAGDSLDFFTKTGAASWDDYPYRDAPGACQIASKKIIARAASSQVYFNQNEASLMELLADKGPLVIYIYSSPGLGSYRSGVFTGSDCGGAKNNHAVTLVGYGVDAASGKDYWLIKNTWGTTWGEGGYFRMVKENFKVCDLGAQAYSVVAA